MSEVWTVYDTTQGWLEDTSDRWVWDVSRCETFPNKEAAQLAVVEMVRNGHDDLGHITRYTGRGVEIYDHVVFVRIK